MKGCINATGVLLATVLSGCVVLVTPPQSGDKEINISVVPLVPTPTSPSEPEVDLTFVEKEPQSSACSPAAPPKVGPLPQIPTPSEDTELRPTDVENLLIDHIIALRDFIGDYESQMKDYHTALIQRCSP